IKALIGKKNWTQAAKLLLMERKKGADAKDLVTRVVCGLLALKTPDPEEQVFELLFKFQIQDQKLWLDAFLAFDAQLIEFEKCARGVLKLAAMHGKLSAESEKFLYNCVFEHPLWLQQSEALPFLKEAKLIQQVFGIEELKTEKMQGQLIITLQNFI